MLGHSLTFLHPKLLLPLNALRHTASSMEGCTGTSRRVLGMPLPPLPTAGWVTAEGLPRQVGEWERDPCPCLAAGDRGCMQHAQAQGGIRAMEQRPGPAALPQLPPVMAWWERVGGPEPLPIAPATSQASRDRLVLELGAWRLWSQGTGTAGLQGCIQPVQPWCRCISPHFWELHACQQRS